MNRIERYSDDSICHSLLELAKESLDPEKDSAMIKAITYIIEDLYYKAPEAKFMNFGRYCYVINETIENCCEDKKTKYTQIANRMSKIMNDSHKAIITNLDAL